MSLKFLTPLVRTIGLIALFWTSWPMALVGFLALGFINQSNFKGRLIIKSDGLRVIVEIITLTLAIIGVWFFPLVGPITASITATIFAALSLASFVWAWAGLDSRTTPKKMAIGKLTAVAGYRNIYRRENGETYIKLNEQFHVKAKWDDNGTWRGDGRAEEFEPSEKVEPIQ